jgi:hypothetical protein
MLRILKANQAVIDTRAAQRLLLRLKDDVRKDKGVPDHIRAKGFMTLEMAVQHLEKSLVVTPRAYWCSECGIVGCSHALQAISKRAVRVSAASLAEV